MKSLKNRHIVCLGGGNAMPKAVLTGLKKSPVKITAICSMLDSGGSSGRLRKDFNIVSPGDIRRAFLALSEASLSVKKLFEYRFEKGELRGHNFANIFIAALDLSASSYSKSLEELAKVLKVSQKVLPATLDNSHLYAVLENGKIVAGESNIDIPKHNPNLKIKRVYLKPKANAYSQAIKEIKKADLIVIGPGDLYSSLMQILLVDGISETIKNSKAKVIYICNPMTKNGETNNFAVRKFTEEIEKYLKDKLDYIIYNNKKPSVSKVKFIRKKHPELIDFVKIDKNLENDKRFIGENLLTPSGESNYKPDKLAKLILSLL
jgi:uncharacterized cofD-like protein